MNKQKIINKKYSKQENEQVSLYQYSIVKESNSDEKFVVLKLKNNEETILKNIEIEITELNSEEVPIKKAVYNLDDLNVKAKKYFIPFTKFRVKTETQTIEYSCLKVIYDNKSSKEEAGGVNNSTNKLKQTKIAIFKTKSKFYPIFIPIIISLVLICLMAINVNAYYETNLDQNGLFEVYKNSNSSVAIVSYNGKSRHVVIPKYYQGKIIDEIGEKAFQFSNIESIEFEGTNIWISEEAFADTFNLTEVKGVSLSTVEENAFRNAKKMNVFKFDDVEVIEENAFSGTKSLKKLEITNIENTIFEHGALTNSSLNNYYFDGRIAVLKNMLISIAPSTKTLVLTNSDEIHSISKNAFKQSSETLHNLTIDVEGVRLTKDNFRNLSKLYVLFLNPLVDADNDLFHNLGGPFFTLEMPVIGTSFSDLFSNNTFTILELIINGTKPLTSSYIDESLFIRRITILDTVPIAS